MMSESEKQSLPKSAERSASKVEPQPQNPETKDGAIIWNLLLVEAGEDVMAKLYSYLQGNECICIVNAIGSLSSFTIRRSDMSTGTFHEGTFDIVNFNGTLMPGEIAGKQEGEGGLKICVVGKEHVPFGGMIAGPVIAKSPIQITLWSKKGAPASLKQVEATQKETVA